MKLRQGLFSILIAISSESSATQQPDASQLFLQCRQAINILDKSKETTLSELFQAQSCLSYLQGFQNGYQTGLKLAHKPQSNCLPKDITTLDVAKLYTTHLENYPYQRHQHPTTVLILAIEQKYPCKN